MLRNAALASAAAALLLAAAAHAGPRAFVASTGSDSNTASGCAPTLPCRSFAAAHGIVDAGGEIIALDSAGYGSLTITKSVTIAANPGVIAGIAAASGDAITILSSGTVKLRGLTIRGAGSGYGVIAIGGGSVSIENCVISNFTVVGLRVMHSSVRVIDSLIEDNGTGIHILQASNVSITGTRVFGQAGDGIQVQSTLDPGTVSAVISDSVSAHNGGAGIRVDSHGAGVNLRATVTRTTAAYNAAGFLSSASAGNATLVLDRSVSTRNGIGVQASGVGMVESLRNNAVRLNQTDVMGTITPISPL